MKHLLRPGQSGQHIIAVATLTAGRTIDGYAYMPARHDRRLAVELLLDGVVASITRADTFVAALWNEQQSDGCFGFSFSLPPSWNEGEWEIRLANTDQILCHSKTTLSVASSPVQGEVRWRSQRRISGFVATEGAGDAITCVSDGRIILQSRANGWSHVKRNGRYQAVRSFELLLPLECADGRPRTVHVYDANGTELLGSPVHLVALHDPLNTGRPTDSDPRLPIFERIFPQSVPLDEWLSWINRWMPKYVSHQNSRRIGVVVLGDERERLARTIQSLEMQEYSEWIATAIPLDSCGTFNFSDLTHFVKHEADSAASILFIANGTVLRCDAMARLVDAIGDNNADALIYPDVLDELSMDSYFPLLYSVFDYERFLEQGYFSSVFMVPASFVGEIQGEERCSAYDIIFRFIERCTTIATANITHLPGPIGSVVAPDNAHALARSAGAHLERRNVPHTVTERELRSPDVCKVMRKPDALSISIIITSHNVGRDLDACLASIRSEPLAAQCPTYLVTSSQSPGVARVDACDITLIESNGDYDRHRLLVRGLETIRSEYVLTIDAKQRFAQPGWFAELCGRVFEGDVAIAAPITVSEQGLITHAGYALGPHYAIGGRFIGSRIGARVYGDLLSVAHEVTAVSSRCALLRMAAISEVGGLEQWGYPEPLRDADLGLRLQRSYWRTVLTPHIAVIDRGAHELDIDVDDQAVTFQLSQFRATWGPKLLNEAFYNPALALDGASFSGLAWPPRRLSPRARF